ncbi:ArsR/SmtB family transcription factor [Streptomyces sp. NPDC002577]
MRQLPKPGSTVSDVMKALSDPIRWDIVQQMADVDELPCAALESTLPVSKPTISYHTKILAQAGLISVRKAGRNFFYSLNREVIRSVMDELWSLAPEPQPVREGRVDYDAWSRRRRARRTDDATQDKSTAQNELTLLTW